ncbi:MAG TPA: CGNR zinc finger domain-containing protein [Streptosporangiaceae bacterium]
MTLPAWVLDDEPKPAPEPLLLVQSFVNTLEVGQQTDLLADPGTATPWLRLAGLLGPEATASAEELRSAREFREGLRALLVRNGGGAAPAASDMRPLETAVRSARLRLAVADDGEVQLDAGPPGRVADGLLGLLLIIRDAQRDGTWRRLKVCANDECRWAFYDRSHSRRGAWCDMATCGNLIKNRNLRARQGGRTAGRRAGPGRTART